MNLGMKWLLRLLALIFALAAIPQVVSLFAPSAQGVRGTDLMLVLIPGAIAFGLWHWSGTVASGGPAMVCTACGHHGPSVATTRGSIWIEIVLWLFLIVPGLIYSLWRLSTRRPACASCGATTLVPGDSPVGRKLIADLGATPGA